MQEIKLIESDSQIMELEKEAQIAFPEYSKLKEDILKLVENMKTVEVNRDNVQVNRKLITAVRKNFNVIDEERKRIKREIMQPYNELDQQVKELKQYLEEGETHITQQVKQLDEQDIIERDIALSEMFHQYQTEYNAPTWLDYESFKKKYPKCLNKSTSEINKKRAIIEWFEIYDKEYAELKEKYPDRSVRRAILTSYKTNGFYMSTAITQYEEMVKEGERLEAEKEARKKTAVPKVTFEPVKKEEPKKYQATLEFDSYEEYEKAMKLLKLDNFNVKKV